MFCLERGIGHDDGAVMNARAGFRIVVSVHDCARLAGPARRGRGVPGDGGGGPGLMSARPGWRRPRHGSGWCTSRDEARSWAAGAPVTGLGLQLGQRRRRARLADGPRATGGDRRPGGPPATACTMTSDGRAPRDGAAAGMEVCRMGRRRRVARGHDRGWPPRRRRRAEGRGQRGR